MTKKNNTIKKSSNRFTNSFYTLFNYLDNKVSTLNTSKVFAGLMIVILNISSKFVTIKLSKTMEGYLKYTFSRDVLVFAICWVGSRDIYVAMVLTALFIFLVDYLLNEESSLCMLSEGFKDYHISLVEGNTTVTDEEIKKAKEILDKAEKQEQEGHKNIVEGAKNQDRNSNVNSGRKNTVGSFSKTRVTTPSIGNNTNTITQ